MKIIIFGNGSGYAVKRRNTSIGIDSTSKILIDIPKAINWLYENEEFANKLNYAIITHAHHDHFGDIEGLVTQKEFIRPGKLKIIIPEDVEVNYLPLYKPKNVKKIKTNYYRDENIEIKFFKVPHLGVPTYGVLVKVDGKCIGYSSDTEKVVLDEMIDCDIIFHDCTGGDYHSSEEEVYNKAKALGILDKVYAIHINDDYIPKFLKLAEGVIIVNTNQIY